MNNNIIIEVEPLINQDNRNNNTRILINFLNNNSISILRILMNVGWFLTSIIIFIQNYNNLCKYYLEYLPMVLSIHSLITLCILICEMFCREYNSLLYINICKSFNRLFDYGFIIYYIFCFSTNECKGLNDEFYRFIYIYFWIEYIFQILIIALLIFLIKCGMRCLFPRSIMRIINNLPIRLGASDEELNKLDYYKYANC